MRYKSIVTLAATVLIAPATGGYHAAASEWGCEVLLCASSSNPSWREVAACHAPMQRLLDAMKGWSFSWPTCPEAGTGKPGYEKYADCPAGWVVGYSESGRENRREPNRCTKNSGACTRHNACADRSVSRPLRRDPYYFDIPADDGSTTRHWFNLLGPR